MPEDMLLNTAEKILKLRKNSLTKEKKFGVLRVARRPTEIFQQNFLEDG